MRDAGVPTLPWSEDAVDGAADVGYPLLVKASAGGGGRGMRIVRDPDELGGGGRVRSPRGGRCVRRRHRLPRAIRSTRARHVEVQVFADTHGNVVSLFERECSIQRRHQKIVEEAPSPAVDASLRARDGRGGGRGRRGSRVRRSRHRRVRPGGRRQLLLPRDEHPAAGRAPRDGGWSPGWIWCGCSSPSPQGLPLPAEALAPAMTGHAIEVRLYAEDAEHGFLPSTGDAARVRRTAPGLGGAPTRQRRRDGQRRVAALRRDAGEGDRARADPSRGGGPARRRRCGAPGSTGSRPTATC